MLFITKAAIFYASRYLAGMPVAYFPPRGGYSVSWPIGRLLTSVVGEITRHVDDYQYREQYRQYNADDHPWAKAVGVCRLQRWVYAWKQRRKRIFYYRIVNNCAHGGGGGGEVNSRTTGAFELMLWVSRPNGYRVFRLNFLSPKVFRLAYFVSI